MQRNLDDHKGTIEMDFLQKMCSRGGIQIYPLGINYTRQQILDLALETGWVHWDLSQK